MCAIAVLLTFFRTIPFWFLNYFSTVVRFIHCIDKPTYSSHSWFCAIDFVFLLYSFTLNGWLCVRYVCLHVSMKRISLFHKCPHELQFTLLSNMETGLSKPKYLITDCSIIDGHRKIREVVLKLRNHYCDRDKQHSQNSITSQTFMHDGI